MNNQSDLLSSLLNIDFSSNATANSEAEPSLPPALAGLAGLASQAKTDPSVAASPEMMQALMGAMTQLEKDDPKAFDELMTKLEADMKRQAEEKGIDLDAAYEKVDRMMGKLLHATQYCHVHWETFHRFLCLTM